MTKVMGARQLILSDLHLGPPDAAIRAENVRDLWRAAGADELIVNGDVAEIHHPDHRAAAAREVLRLTRMAEDDGIKLTLVSGNHDSFLTDQRHLLLADGEVFVTHGDVLHPAIAPWSAAAKHVRAAHDQAMKHVEPDAREDMDVRLSVAQHAAQVEWDGDDVSHTSVWRMIAQPWRAVQVLAYWRAVPGLAAEFAAEHTPKARFVIIGHSHRAGMWMRSGRIVINTGSFGFPGRPQGVIVDEGAQQLTVHRLRRAGGSWRMVSESVADYALSGSHDAAPSAVNTRAVGIRPSTAAM